MPEIKAKICGFSLCLMGFSMQEMGFEEVMGIWAEKDPTRMEWGRK